MAAPAPLTDADEVRRGRASRAVYIESDIASHMQYGRPGLPAVVQNLVGSFVSPSITPEQPVVARVPAAVRAALAAAEEKELTQLLIDASNEGAAIYNTVIVEDVPLDAVLPRRRALLASNEIEASDELLHARGMPAVLAAFEPYFPGRHFSLAHRPPANDSLASRAYRMVMEFATDAQHRIGTLVVMYAAAAMGVLDPMPPLLARLAPPLVDGIEDARLETIGRLLAVLDWDFKEGEHWHRVAHWTPSSDLWQQTAMCAMDAVATMPLFFAYAIRLTRLTQPSNLAFLRTSLRYVLNDVATWQPVPEWLTQRPQYAEVCQRAIDALTQELARRQRLHSERAAYAESGIAGLMEYGLPLPIGRSAQLVVGSFLSELISEDAPVVPHPPQRIRAADAAIQMRHIAEMLADRQNASARVAIKRVHDDLLVTAAEGASAEEEKNKKPRADGRLRM